MATPLTPQERSDIETAIRNGEPRNAIARRFNRSPGTVTKIAQDAKIDSAFDRTATMHATKAKQADNASRRAALVERLYGLTESAVAEVEALDAGGRYVLVHPCGNGSVIEKEVARPPAKDRQHLATTAAIWLDKATNLEKVDAGSGGEAASLIEQLFDGMVGR